MKAKICLSTIATLVLCSSLNAQTNASESSVYDLGRIEVVSKEDISQNRAIDYVESSAIKDANAKTVVEALQSVPGVYTTYSGARGETNIRIRGFNSYRVPIYIDGIPVYVPYDRNMDLGRFKTYDVGEISVSKGYVSPMYGASTMGGAVNIITKKPTRSFEGEVGAGLMSGDGHEEWATLGTKQDLFYALLSVSNIQRDYYKLPSDFVPDIQNHQMDRNRNNAEYKDRKLNLKVGFTPNDTDEYSFNYIMQRGDKEQPWATHPTYSVIGNNQYDRNWHWKDWDKTSYYFITKTQFSEMFTLKTRWYYDEFYNKMFSYGAPGTALSKTVNEISIYDDNTYGGVIEGDIKFNENHLLKLMVSKKYDNHEDKYDMPANWVNAKAEAETLSIGAEYSWKINDIFTWVIGGNWDKNEVEKAEMRANNRQSIQGEYPKYDSDAFNPQTILYAQLTPEFMMYGSFSKKSNMPTLKDRYSSRFGTYVANPSLKAERSTTYELGGEYVFDNSHFLKAAIFYTKTDDYIGEVRNIVGTDPSLGCVGATCRQYQNIDEETHKGFELSLSSYWSEKISGTFAYTYIDAEIDKSTTTGAKYVTDVPEHSFYASLKYSPIPSLDIVPTIRYESERYTDVTGSEKSSSYTVADLRVAYRPINDLEISVGIKNLFDEYYYYNNWYPQEGRSYYANVRYSF
ncbi:MAG: TonB-dependent receptor plug domain-containing protein [Campylobacteraceae bacterium]